MYTSSLILLFVETKGLSMFSSANRTAAVPVICCSERAYCRGIEIVVVVGKWTKQQPKFTQRAANHSKVALASLHYVHLIFYENKELSVSFFFFQLFIQLISFFQLFNKWH